MPNAVSPPVYFVGQHYVIVPDGVVRRARHVPLIAPLLPTAAGFFPRAAGHDVNRPAGARDAIVIVCRFGRGFCEMDGRRHAVEPGEALFIPARVPHRYGADADNPWSIVWAHVEGRDVAHFLRALEIRLRRPKLRVSAECLERLALSRVYEVLEEGYSSHHLATAGAALRATLAEIWHEKLTPRALAEPSDPVRRVIDWMRKNLERSASLDEIASRAGVSPSHLSKLFRRTMGYPPADYFMRLKIQESCRLLDSTRARVKEIGAAVGFSDAYYYSRVFRNVMGMSPRAYRTSPRR